VEHQLSGTTSRMLNKIGEVNEKLLKDISEFDESKKIQPNRDISLCKRLRHIMIISSVL
jgi:hypothetical protein